MHIILKKHIAVFCILPLLFWAFKGHDEVEAIKFSNFIKAMKNNSTFSYFTVVKIKNLNTGEIREVCTKGNFVSGALHTELNIDYDDKGENAVLRYAIKSKDRYFELRNKKALDNISFFDFSQATINAVEKKYNIDSIIATINKYQKFSVRLGDEEMKSLAYILFNKGYLTGENNCFGGALVYVSKTLEKQIED